MALQQPPSYSESSSSTGRKLGERMLALVTPEQGESRDPSWRDIRWLRGLSAIIVVCAAVALFITTGESVTAQEALSGYSTPVYNQVVIIGFLLGVVVPLIAFIITTPALYRLSAALLLGSLTLAPYLIVLAPSVPPEYHIETILIYAISSIIVCATFFSSRLVVAFIIFHLAAQAAIPLTTPKFSMEHVLITIPFILFNGMLLSRMIDHRTGIERDRADLAARIERVSETERSKIARDLHDTVTQNVFAGRMVVSKITRLVDNGKQEAALEDLARLKDILDNADDMLRSMLVELSPLEQSLVSLSVEHMIAQVVSTYRTQILAKIVVETLGNVEISFAPELQKDIYRICQECVSNVAKHAASATELRIAVSVDILKDTCSIDIEDDGPGFDMQTLPVGHFGVRNVRARLNLIEEKYGGMWSYTSQPGHGTKLTLEIAHMSGRKRKAGLFGENANRDSVLSVP